MSFLSETVPLLPLPAVLFPGTLLPLQVSENAHRSLMTECMEQGNQIGVVLTPGQQGKGRSAVPCTTGCLASVAMVLNDGDESMSVVLHGEQRIRVVDFVQQTPYYAGRVETLDDYSGQHAERRTRQAAEIFQRYLKLIRERYQTHVVDMPLPDDPIMASYLLAAVLYRPLEIKQRWLESSSATARLEEELAFLTTECEKLATLLALSQHAQRHYLTPDYHLFVQLISKN